MQHVKTVADAIEYLKEQIGITLKPSAVFPAIKRRAGRRFFTAELESPVFCSKQYAALEAYANQYNSIRVESGGHKLVTIFIL
mgnify:CR=1 FL=1